MVKQRPSTQFVLLKLRHLIPTMLVSYMVIGWGEMTILALHPFDLQVNAKFAKVCLNSITQSTS